MLVQGVTQRAARTSPCESKHGVQEWGAALAVSGGGETIVLGLQGWQTPPQCLGAWVVQRTGPGEKGHDCGCHTLTTSGLRSLQEWGTWEATEGAGPRVQLRGRQPPQEWGERKRTAGPRALHKISKDFGHPSCPGGGLRQSYPTIQRGPC